MISLIASLSFSSSVLDLLLLMDPFDSPIISLPLLIVVEETSIALAFELLLLALLVSEDLDVFSVVLSLFFAPP